MNNPIVALLPLAILIGIFYVLMRREEKRARSQLSALSSPSFVAGKTFDLSNVLVAFDSAMENVAFTNVPIVVSPQNRSSFTVHMSQVFAVASISQLQIRKSNVSVSITVAFADRLKNTFNNAPGFVIVVPVQQYLQSLALLEAWPIRNVAVLDSSPS